MDDLERSLRCDACGAVWKSPAAHQIALRDGKCLRCGGGPLIDELTGEVARGRVAPTTRRAGTTAD